jgi:hypothetical protein
VKKQYCPTLTAVHEAILPGLLVRVVVYMTLRVYSAILEYALSSAISGLYTGEQKTECAPGIEHWCETMPLPRKLHLPERVRRPYIDDTGVPDAQTFGRVGR